MPGPFHPKVNERIQELWELHKKRGDSLIARLEIELLDGRAEWTKNLPDGKETRLPTHRSSINKLAKTWRKGAATPAMAMAKFEDKDEKEDDGPISGIIDAVWHLSKILAGKKAYEYTHHSHLYKEGVVIPNSFRSATVDQIVFAIAMDVDEAYRPHQKMFAELEPLIIEWVTEGKKSYQHMVEVVSKSDGTLIEINEGGK